MRRSSILAIVALALMPLSANAQQAPAAASTPQAAPAQTATPASTPAEEEYVPPQKNVIDFGLRGTSVTGDRARYERYRDLGDGLFLEGFRLHRQTQNNWFLDLNGEHVGRLDQRYVGTMVLPGKVEASVKWDQVPTLFSTSTRTLFTTSSPDVLVINDAIQNQMQNTASSLQAATLKGLASDNATGFTLKNRRYIGEGSFRYIVKSESAGAGLGIRNDLSFTQNFRFMSRSGQMPYGGAFGHGNFVETLAPVNHQTNDFNGNGEYLHGPLLVRVGYVASLFHNDYSSFTFDNPWRLTDISSAASRGRTSLPASNSMFSINGLASVKFAGRSRISAYVSSGVLKNASDAQILSQTINSAATNLQALPRNTINGEGRTNAVNLTFTSRPTKYIDINARFRTYDYDNRTPEFSIYQRVSYDNAPSTSATPITTEPFGIKRQNFDADVRFIPRSALSAGIGFSSVKEDRSLRMFEETTENITRLTVDSVGTRWFALRSRFEFSRKRGTLNNEAYDEMVAAGEQPGMRQFDIASRDRTRATIVASVTPSDVFSVNFSAAKGHDDYVESVFGLRDNKHQVYSAGFDAAPGDNVVVGLTYSLEDYDAIYRSRTANPGAQQVDETRNWANTQGDKVHSLLATAQFLKLAQKVDVKFTVDLSRSRGSNFYTYGALSGYLLPGENPNLVSSLTPPQQLPDLVSRLGRTTADVTYALSSHIGIGVTYWYEKYEVSDFTLDQAATPALSFSNALLTGYMWAPYTANTVWGRLVYRW